MSANPNRKRGKNRKGNNLRGSGAEHRDIHSKIRGVAVHRDGVSNFKATVTDKAVYYGAECFDEERKQWRELGLKPRESYEESHMLPFFPQQVEMEVIPTRELKVGGGMGPSQKKHYRVTWKSDKHLLNRLPTDDITRVPFKREGSISQGQHTRKFTLTQREKEQPTERVIENATPDIDFE